MSSSTRRLFGLGLAGAALCPAMAAAAEPGPKEIVTAIYRRAVAGKGDSGGQFIWLKPKDRRTYFTRRMANLWERADRATPKGDQHPPGFDPVTVSQDPNVKSFDVTLEEDGPERAGLLVNLTGHGEAKPYAAVRYTLLRENGLWLIDEIASAQATGADAWSLRKLLESHLAAARPAR
jgi:hypothetical protein